MQRAIFEPKLDQGHSWQNRCPKPTYVHIGLRRHRKQNVQRDFPIVLEIFQIDAPEKSLISGSLGRLAFLSSLLLPRLMSFPWRFGSDSEHRYSQKSERICCSMPRVAETPSHQFPLGMTMSLARRTALINFARVRDAFIFEDDHSSEFRFNGPPLPCLQGLDNSGRVIYAGTMSKVLFPSLRLGYLLLPEELVEPMIKIRAVMDQHSSAIDQATLARFITEGFFLSHIKQMRKLYADRRDFFFEEFNRLLGKYFRVQPPDAGLHFVAWLRPRIDIQRVMRACDDVGLKPMALSSFCIK